MLELQELRLRLLGMKPQIDDLAERFQCVHCRVLRFLRADESLYLGRKKHVESNQTLQVLSQQTLCDFDRR